jgi:hypothetical protein
MRGGRKTQSIPKLAVHGQSFCSGAEIFREISRLQFRTGITLCEIQAHEAEQSAERGW